ncbi:MAG: hypothetical protein HC796_11730, partial [Synechococcaceae cyanobacterium RL_1_2]|nr:hypothetical protein [Synechococcaceae cyanobacterium RL_1_2]
YGLKAQPINSLESLQERLRLLDKSQLYDLYIDCLKLRHESRDLTKEPADFEQPETTDFLNNNNNLFNLNSDQISSVSKAIYPFHKKLIEVTHHKSNFWKKLERLVSSEKFRKQIPPNKFLEYLKETLNDLHKQASTPGANDMDKRTIVLALGLLVAAVITVVIVSNNKNAAKSKLHTDNNKQPPTPSKKKSTQQAPRKSKLPTNKQLLVLVLQTTGKTIISRIKEQREIQENDWQELYKETKYLWTGAEQEFKNCDFATCFDGTHQAQEQSPSDVYFLKIELTETIQGFERDNYNRSPAFKKLPIIGKYVDNSARLTFHSFDNPHLYKKA